MAWENARAMPIVATIAEHWADAEASPAWRSLSSERAVCALPLCAGRRRTVCDANDAHHVTRGQDNSRLTVRSRFPRRRRPRGAWPPASERCALSGQIKSDREERITASQTSA